MGLAPAPWPLCCFALHVAEQTDFLLGPVSVSPVVIERLNWHLGWPPPPAQISGLRGAGQLAGVPAGQHRGAGRGEASLSEAGAQGALRALRLALPVRAASGGRREHPGSAVSQEELACCPPLPRERQGPFRSLPRLPAPPAGGDGRRLALSKPSTAPHCLGGAGGDGALPVSVGALCGTAVTGLLVSDAHSTGRPKWLCSL